MTFARSMVERVIEEKSAGDPARAAAIRTRVGALIGDSLRDIRAGSPEAQEVKTLLIAEGLWSQYLEVGIGPDAEVFSKAQVLSAVGPGADVGLHPISTWNNPEPEIVLAVSSRGTIMGLVIGCSPRFRLVVTTRPYRETRWPPQATPRLGTSSGVPSGTGTEAGGDGDPARADFGGADDP
ncbi:hypothetical protein [Falsirhodobacter halotolerans]|uniref:hypothetical protein n=1 Tax=Falsirhodobacter halotolerans TaxID=1146892 RepID=UPI00314038CC